MIKFNIKNILPALLVLLAILDFRPVALGQTWSEIQPEANYWVSTAMSEDGARILAVPGREASQNGGLLKLSTDGGSSWTNAGPTPNVTKNWQDVVMSSDGRYMSAAENGGRIYSSSDYGVSWIEILPAGNVDGYWRIAMSDNGLTLLAANLGGRLYRSSNNGVTWTELQPAGNNTKIWSIVAVSGDGNTFLAGIYNAYNVFVSHDAGATWSTSPGYANQTLWWSADFSYDGQIAYVVTLNNVNPVKSTDGLLTWTNMAVGNTSTNLAAISCSSDGQTLAIVSMAEDKIFYSTNAGASWNNHPIPVSYPVNFEGSGVSVSSDGNTILALTKDYTMNMNTGVQTSNGRIYKGVFPESTPPTSGDGTAANPYQIATLANLCWLSSHQAQWGNFKYFIQTADIDAAATSTWNSDGLGGYYGFSPIGTLNELTFQGTYDGNGKTISNLYINRPGLLNSGLFGSIDGTVKNLGVLNADITGGTYAGILTGFTNSTVNNCYTSGNVKGVSAGGLIGWLGNGLVELCYSSASVQTTADGAGSKAGGLIGEMTAATLQNCYAQGSVSGTTGNCIGGLIGQSQYNVIVKKSYAKGAVTLVGTSSYAGGFIGNGIYWIESPYVFEDCYWDTQTSGQAASSGGIGVVGKTTAEMLTQSTYTNWNFSYPWNMSVGDYPILDIFGPSYSGGNGTQASPYQIANINDLQVLDIFPAHWSKHFIQTADIDAAGVALIPIGDSDNNFTGYYNGQNFTIDHFTYDGMATNDMKVGFFKVVIGASLKNIKLTNLNLSAFYGIGGLAGFAVNTIIDNCFVSGNLTSLLIGGGLVGVSGNNTFTRCGADIVLTGNPLYGAAVNTHLGGFVGLVEGSSSFTDCYAIGSVSGYKIGGFVGGLDMNSTPLGGSAPIDPTMGFTLANCYAANTLTVSAGGEKGGLYGQSGYAGSNILITNSFWDKDITGTTYGYIGGTSKTTTEMKTQGTFTGWDFATPVWSLKSTYNGGYPNLEGLTEPLVIAWTGTTSANWNTSTNWSTGSVPTNSDHVTIPDVANDPIANEALGTPAVCNNLTIQSGAVLTIASGKALTVSGTLTNSAGTAGLLIHSGGSLIQNNSDAAATVKCAVAGDDKFHLFISPINEPLVANASSCFSGAYVDKYNEPTGEWERLLTGANVESANGYSVNFANGSPELAFPGTLKASPASYTNLAITAGAPGYGGGWNLIGNPYPCGINTALLPVPAGMNATAYVWDEGISGNYIPLTIGPGSIAPGIIATMQGFFVKTASADNTLTLANNAKVHGGTFYKSSNTVPQMLTLFISGNGYSDKTFVLFNDNATENFDQSFDAYKLAGLDEAPQLYSMLPGEKAAINTLPSTVSNQDVALGLKVGATTTYTIQVEGINSFDPSMPISFDDLKLGTSQDLRLNPDYSFTASPGDAENRFRLSFATVTGRNLPEASGISINAKNGIIRVSCEGTNSGKVFVYSTSGQLIATSILTSGETSMSVASTGVYMVKVVTGKTSLTRKLVVLQ